MSGTLHLVLTHHWYDMIAGGTKTVEYRAMTPHWKRLIWDRRDTIVRVRFARGYTKTTLTRTVRAIDVGPCLYDGWPAKFYRIHFGG